MTKNIVQRIQKRFGIGDFDRFLDMMFPGGEPSWSGETVSESESLNFAPVHACVNAVSKDLSSLPLILCRNGRNGAREDAVGHSLYKILGSYANEELTSREYRAVTQAHMMAWGNGFSYIDLDLSNRIKGLYVLTPDRMRVRRFKAGTRLRYFYDVRGTGLSEANVTSIIGPGFLEIPWEHVFHLRGLGFDGITGYSVIALARQSLGLMKAQQKAASSLFGNGISQAGVLEVEGEMTDEAYKRLRDSWTERYGGAGNAFKTVILEEGAKFKSNTINPTDAQFLESRGFSTIETLQWFDVPGVRINYADKTATYASAEQFFRAYVQFSLLPWAKLWEQNIGLQLLDRSDEYYAYHNFDSLLEGDTKSQAEFYRIMVTSGIWMPADVLRRQRLPVTEASEVYYRPLAMAYVKPDGEVTLMKGAADETAGAGTSDVSSEPPPAGGDGGGDGIE